MQCHVDQAIEMGGKSSFLLLRWRGVSFITDIHNVNILQNADIFLLRCRLGWNEQMDIIHLYDGLT